MGGEFVVFSPKTTSKVLAFENLSKMNESCNEIAAQNVLDEYYNLSTFERNQFNSLVLSEGVTGLDRINYLITRFNFTTINDTHYKTNTDNSLTATIFIGVIGITTIAGYYFITKKSEQRI